MAVEKKRQTSKNRILKRFIAICAAAAVVLAAAIFFIYNNAEPEQVQGLSAKATFARIKLSWDIAGHADGYDVYVSDGGDFIKADTLDGKETTSWKYKDYEHDKPYSFKVVPLNRNPLTHKATEGEASEEVSAEYETAKYAQKIPIITYHKIIPKGHTFTSTLLVTEDTFEEHMKYLHDNGYKTITPDEFYQWHKGKKEFPVKTVMVTFDDGFYGTYYLAYPIIKKYDQAATVFCIGKNSEGVTDEFDPDAPKDHYVRQDVIEKMRTEYPRFSFESHTYDMHNRVDGKKPAKGFTYEQIVEDCKKCDKFGFRYLAYPWGTYSKKMQRALKDSGYKMAFAYRPFYYALRSDDRYAVNRLKISGKITMDNFIRIVSGEAEEMNNPDAQ